MFLEPSLVGIGASGAANNGSNAAASTLPRAESTLFRMQNQQQQQSLAINPNPGVWMNTLSKKNSALTGSLNLPYSQTQSQMAVGSSSRYNLAQVDANLQLQQQIQQLQIRFFKGISFSLSLSVTF